MGLSITTYPKKQLYGSQYSKWGAVHQPITFEMLRADIVITSAILYDDQASFYTTGDISEVVPGDMIYVNCGIYVGLTEVLDINFGNLIRTDFNYNGNQGTGYMNLIDARPNYYIETRVLGIESNTYYVLGTSVNKPFSDGSAKVNIKEWLKPLVGFKNDFTYDVVNKKDTNIGKGYNIQYREMWTGYEGTFTTPSDTELYYYVNSAKQVAQIHGFNMGEYVPYIQDSPLADVTNQYFTDPPWDFGWVAGSNWVSAGGGGGAEGNGTADLVANLLIQLNVFADYENDYTIEFDIDTNGDDLYVYFGTNLVDTLTTTGTHTVTGKAVGTLDLTLKLADGTFVIVLSVVPVVVTSDSTARFMSDFQKPTFFPGYPFDLSFLYSDLIAGFVMSKRETTLDVNGDQIATAAYTLDHTQSQHPNRLMLEESYSASTKQVNVSIESGVSVCENYVAEDYVEAGYTEQHCGLIQIALPE